MASEASNTLEVDRRRRRTSRERPERQDERHCRRSQAECRGCRQQRFVASSRAKDSAVEQRQRYPDGETHQPKLEERRVDHRDVVHQERLGPRMPAPARIAQTPALASVNDA